MKTNHRNSKVLVVEDDFFMLKVISKRLEEDGYDVECVENGREALEKVEEQHFPVIILDLMMPVMSGFEFLDEFRKENDDTAVFVVTNISDRDELEKAKKLGASKCYVKSEMDFDEVCREIEECIR